MSKYTISVLGILLVLTCAGNVWGQVFIGNTTFVIPSGFEKHPALQFKPLDPHLPKVQLEFDEKSNKYLAATFYGGTEKTDVLFQNNLSLKARFYANINEKLRAVAQFRCSDYCDNLALSITILGRNTGQVFDQKEMVLARIR